MATPTLTARPFAGANNFDLIRLLAALQVAVKHTLHHFGVESPWTVLLGMMPGVPVFFFISGFLIYQSWQNSSATSYFRNRSLRIFPGLIGCTVFGLALVLASGYLSTQQVPAARVAFWFATQVTVLQMYNPDFLRGFGVGVLNGSLWTISVELCFYVLTPLVFYLTRKRRWVWAPLVLAFCLANVFMPQTASSTIEKAYSISFVPWLYMFLVGAWLSTQPALVARILSLHLAAVIGINVLVGGAGHLLGLAIAENAINPASFCTLVLLILKLAYTMPELSRRIVGRNDISYGVYIFHMPVVNVMLFYGLSGVVHVWVALGATLAMATISWFIIEKPALSLKRTSTRHDA